MEFIMITFSDLTPSDPIYVINKTKTDFSFLLFDSANNPRLYTVPRSSIPQCITEEVPFVQLKNSSEFRSSLKNILQLVDPKEAKEILSTREAQVEREYLNKKYSAIPEELLASTPDIDFKDPSVDEAMQTDFAQDIRDELKDIVLDTNLTSSDKLAKIIMQNKEEVFTIKELEFLKVSIDSSASNVVNWVNSQISKSKGIFSKK